MLRTRLLTSKAALFASAITIFLASQLCAQTLSADEAKQSANELTLVTLNLAHGRGSSFNQLLLPNNRFLPNLNSIATTLEPFKADIVALQEADEASSWSGNFNHVEALAEKLQLSHIAHGIHIKNSMASYGTAVISRLPIINKKAHTFAGTWPTPSKGFTLATIAWQTEENTPPVEVTVVSVHLDFSRQSVRFSQIGELVEVLGAENKPVIIMGDFNNEDIAREFLPKRLKEKKLEVSAYDINSKDLNTYGDRRLDWILISKEMTFIDYKTLDEALSDHSAIVARIRWQPAQPIPAKEDSLP